MFHFLMPDYLGTHERFNRLFRNPIAKHGELADAVYDGKGKQDATFDQNELMDLL